MATEQGKNRSRGHKRKVRHRTAVIFTILLAAFVGWQVGAAFRQSRLAEAKKSERQQRLALALASQVLKGDLRQVFPFSVIPGGIGSVDEIKSAMGRDPVIAAHYSKFDVNKARFFRADAERHVYVSYRIGDQIYWTSKRLTLKPGELLVTDGEITGRGRCGNQISDVARKPVFSGEPSVQAFDTPEMAPPEVTIAQRSLNAMPDLVEGSAFRQPDSPSHTPGSAIVPPLFYPFGGAGGGGTNSTPPVTPVPEPGTVAMLFAGLAGAGWLCRRNRCAATRGKALNWLQRGGEVS